MVCKDRGEVRVELTMRPSGGRRHHDPPVNELVVIEVTTRSCMQPAMKRFLRESLFRTESRLGHDPASLHQLQWRAKAWVTRYPPNPNLMEVPIFQALSRDA